MSDQPVVYDSDDLIAPSARPGWIALVSTADIDLTERYGRLLEHAEIPFLLEETVQVDGLSAD